MNRAALCTVLALSACGGGGSGGGVGGASGAAAPASAAGAALAVSPILAFSVSDKTFAVGTVHGLAIKSDGSLHSWGSNINGERGNSNQTSSLTPVLIPSTPTWSLISAGGSHTLGQRSDGTLWSWGNNTDGQVGLNDQSRATITTPTAVKTTPLAKDISAGGAHSVVVLTDGSLWSWGRNFNGQLGQGTNSDVFKPTQVGTLKTWDSVSAGGAHTLAKQSGTNYLYAWGANANGQLGQLGTVDSSIPVWINLLAPQTAAVFSAGGTHSLAITTDGNLWSWGGNASGQLGDGLMTYQDSTVPILVSSTGNWWRVAAGGYHSLAVRLDGTLWSWGDNTYGQLGNGSLNLPVNSTVTQIGTASNWVAVAAGEYASMAVQANGSLWVWGRNDLGQLGLGNNTSPIPTPTQLP